MNKKTRLLNFLKEGPKTTYELCVAGFAGSYRQRISDLRKEGYQITAQTKTRNGQRYTTFYLVSCQSEIIQWGTSQQGEFILP